MINLKDFVIFLLKLHKMNIYMRDTNKPFSSTDAIFIFLAFFCVLLLVATVKKVFYYFKFKKRYYIFPRPSVQGIANIAMVTALSVAVLLLLTFITSNAFSVLFRAFPGSRVTIESILIKIGGLLFGPFIGMFVGALTDILSIIMTAGIFHYGYFIAAVGSGLLAGLIKSVITYSGKNKLAFAIVTTIVFLVSSGISLGFVYTYIDPNGIQQSVFPFLIPDVIPRNVLVYVFTGWSIFVPILIWFLFFFSRVKEAKKEEKNQKHFGGNKRKKVDKNYYTNFCLVLICVMICELIINVLMMPAFDADISTLKYGDWLTIRLLLFFPMIIFNFLIIYPVYTIVWPLVKWDYKEELVEDYSIPLYV